MCELLDREFFATSYQHLVIEAGGSAFFIVRARSVNESITATLARREVPTWSPARPRGAIDRLDGSRIDANFVYSSLDTLVSLALGGATAHG